MTPFQAIALGIIQGLTEFLPISSSGHLVIFQNLFGLKDPELFFDVSVHMGTLIAVVVVFWKEIRAMAISLKRAAGDLFSGGAFFSRILEDEAGRLFTMILAGSVPTAVIGLMLRRVADRMFSSVVFAGCMLLLTGAVIWSTRRIREGNRPAVRISLRDALVIGTVQGIAVIPGISRSGSTIAAGLHLGLSRETAGRYSFLLSVPAILGAEILSMRDMTASFSVSSLLPAVLGAGAAFLVGYAALKWLIGLLERGKLHHFAPYCWFAGALVIATAKW